MVLITILSSTVGVQEGSRFAVHSSPMSCIEAEQEGSAALLCILYDLVSGTPDSSVHSAVVCILVALDLVLAEPILLNAFLKLVSLLSGTRHVSIDELVSYRAMI